MIDFKQMRHAPFHILQNKFLQLTFIMLDDYLFLLPVLNEHGEMWKLQKNRATCGISADDLLFNWRPVFYADTIAPSYYIYEREMN